MKWNNHKSNISGVMDRLRLEQRFVDVTLASADRKTIGCHRVLISAGSGYLEDILSENPCEHPTVVLSQIDYEELRHLVDFMYAGEVAVDQDRLAKLLEAAKILKIKGLYDEQEQLLDEQGSIASEGTEEPEEVVVKEPEQKVDKVMALKGSQKRKRKSHHPNQSSSESKKRAALAPDTTQSPPASPDIYSPMFGISNAYFLTQTPPPLKNLLDKSGQNVDEKDHTPILLSKDMPNLLCQTPLSPSSLMMSVLKGGNATTLADSAIGTSIIDKKDNSMISSAPVRRYKQYTEDTLQQALKEIMEGQSINRSSMKYNIPARTLRDWMKRLNIKSVFTHHSQKDGRTLSADSSEYNSEENGSETSANGGGGHSGSEQQVNPTADTEQANGVAFPGMTLPFGLSMTSTRSEETEEEEIDDDEEGLITAEKK